MIEANEVLAHFDAVAARFMEPLDDLLELCYPVVLQSNRDNLTSSASPDGIDFPPRKIEGDGHPLLEDTGAMLQAATGGGAGHVHDIEHTGNGADLVVGIALDVIPYARAQALGYKPRNLPSRQFLGLHQAGEDRCEQILADGMEKRFDGNVAVSAPSPAAV